MRLSLLTVLALAGCGDGVVSGAASSSLDATAQSATVIVVDERLEDPPGTYRRWSISITADPPGTACEVVGDPLMTIDVWTLFNSAPRGEMAITDASPPVLFPAAYVSIPGAIATQGTLFISQAATTGLVGQVGGYANLGGTLRAMDVTFDAPTCGP